MPTDIESIVPLIEQIKTATAQFTQSDGSSNNRMRLQLIRAAEQLAIAAREPEENLYFTATQTAQNAAIRSAIEMGAFEAVPSDGRSISAHDLAQMTGAEKQLVVRIIRACASTHIFTETSPEHYAHNPFSRIFTVTSNRDMFRQMYDFAGKAVYLLPHFLASTGWKNPTDYDNSPFQFGHQTKLGIWEYLQEDPARMAVFNSGMRSLATIGTGKKNHGPYPFGMELGGAEYKDGEVLLVDVGGGRGQALEAIKSNFPALKGRMILQDTKEVIEDAKKRRLPNFIEPQVASFFEPQPVKGAYAYHFRRIFHDWSDEKSVEILRNTTPAMERHSRILIADNVVPEVNAPRALALQDLNMMSFSGLERTEKQWAKLLDDAGLQLVKVWQTENEKHAMVEARLK